MRWPFLAAKVYSTAVGRARALTLGIRFMEQFDYQHLDGLTLEAIGCALRLDYSEPDQGGTRLLHRFRIPIKGAIEIESGYAYDPSLSKREIAFAEIPPRVIQDAIVWLKQQHGYALSTGNSAIAETIEKFQERIQRK